MKIYVITGSYGEYSDHTEWSICACYNEDRVKELIEQIKKLAEYKREFEQRVRDEFFTAFDKEHPSPQLPAYLYNKRGILRGPIKGEHIAPQQQLEEHYMRFKAYDNMRHEAEQEWRKNNYHTPLFECDGIKNCDIGNTNGDVDYDYHELDIL